MTICDGCRFLTTSEELGWGGSLSACINMDFWKDTWENVFLLDYLLWTGQPPVNFDPEKITKCTARKELE